MKRYDKFISGDVVKPTDESEYRYWGILIIFCFNSSEYDNRYVLFSCKKNQFRNWPKYWCEMNLEKINK